ncbi:MAG: hypothetical protein IPP41_15150 [Rhodocyclaceae bacterium]|nr:hypothetical protein [Rhodocyclaceae bacterium]
MNTWYAVVCKPRREARAEFNLVNQGYQVFLPRLAEQTRRNGKWVGKLEPLSCAICFWPSLIRCGIYRGSGLPLARVTWSALVA